MAKATEPASLDDLLCGSPLVNRQGKRLSLEDAIGDADAAEFQEYFNEMPWDLAFPLKSQIVTSLMNMWGIQGIPTLALVDKTGKLLTLDMRSDVMRDPTAAKFPYTQSSEALAAAKSGGGAGGAISALLVIVGGIALSRVVPADYASYVWFASVMLGLMLFQRS